MNFAKKRTAELFLKMIEKASLKKSFVAERMGFDPFVISNLANSKYINNIGPLHWTMFTKAINSGEHLINYLDKYYPVYLNDIDCPGLKDPPALSSPVVDLQAIHEANSLTLDIDINLTIKLNGKEIRL